MDPGRPSGTSPWRFLCVGFWLVNTIAICTMLANGAVSCLGDCGLPCGRRDSLCTLHLFRSALLRTSSIAATLGMSGWLLLTQQGLSPCKKRQASLDALTIEFSGCRRQSALEFGHSGGSHLECAGLTALCWACGFDAGPDCRREQKLPTSVSGAFRR